MTIIEINGRTMLEFTRIASTDDSARDIDITCKVSFVPLGIFDFDLPYSGKLWQGLYLVNQSPERLGEF